jgi:predicted nucleotidyltransferase
MLPIGDANVVEMDALRLSAEREQIYEESPNYGSHPHFTSHLRIPDFDRRRCLMTTATDMTSIIGHAEIAAFAESNVNLPHSAVTEYRERVNRLRDSLQAKIAADSAYAVVRVRNAGSLAKGTALRTTSDFDLAVYVRPDSVPQDPTQLSPWLIARLKEARPQLDDDQFETHDHCVSIVYKDGRRVDIVPILDAGDGSGDGDLIRKDTGDKVRTNVRRHIEFVRARKARCPVHYRQVIRLLKWWAAQQKAQDETFRFKSYFAELLCSHLLDTGTNFSSYPDALASIFTYIKVTGLTTPIIFEDYYKRSAVPNSAHGIMTVIDAVNPENNILRDYTESHRRAIVSAAGSAVDAIDYAEFIPNHKRNDAIAAWAEILGHQFRG